jgi:2-polyprenyl-3-methyl-5-hydroxy-6-metoxy-1,4-benzoquinol methylase
VDEMKRCRVHLDLVSAIEHLKSPVQREQFIRHRAAKGPAQAVRAAEIWDLLDKAGLLEDTSATEQPIDATMNFERWRSQRGMLADTARTSALQRAIEAVVQPGMTVIDVGSGSGILSFFAARAGAAQVYALEATSVIEDSRLLAVANGLADRITFVAGDAGRFVAPNRVDVVLGDWVGMYLFEAWRTYDAFTRVRDVNLKPGGTCLPLKADIYLCPIDDSRLYVERGPGYWERPVWGFDFGLVHHLQRHPVRRIIVQAYKHCILKVEKILTLDCSCDGVGAYFFEHAFDMTFDHDASCHGFLGFFTRELTPGIVLDTSPYSLDTCMHQSYFPMELIQIQRGDTLQVRVRSDPDPFTGSPVLSIKVELMRAGRVEAAQDRVYTLDDTQG